MSDQGLDTVDRARPYGWVGLPLTLLAIPVIGTGLCVAAVAAAFGVAVALLGWHDAVIRTSSFKEALKADPQTSEAILLAASIVIYFVTALVVFFFARLRGGRGWRDLVAWLPWDPRRGSRLFWLIVGATLIYSLAANEALAYFYPASQKWVELPTGAVSMTLFFIVAVLSAPMTEELIFRGWLYTGLRAKLSVWPSLLISSALFALAHWESTHLYALVVFPVGIALGLIRERAGSLRASMSFHALYNGVAFLMLCLGH